MKPPREAFCCSLVLSVSRGHQWNAAVLKQPEALPEGSNLKETTTGNTQPSFPLLLSHGSPSELPLPQPLALLSTLPAASESCSSDTQGNENF